MKSNELRIGNLVNYLREAKTVLGIDEETVFLKHTISINYLDLDEIEPIQLTEEWLLRMGFEKRRGIFYKFGRYQHTISLNKNGDSYRMEIVSQSVAWVKHIHQLQNLYFALTGEELLITCK